MPKKLDFWILNINEKFLFDLRVIRSTEQVGVITVHTYALHGRGRQLCNILLQSEVVFICAWLQLC